MMRARLIAYILRSLHAADGLPLPESALIGAVQSLARPADPTDADVRDAIKDAEGRRYVSGLSDDLAGTSWTLTETGKHKVRGLR